MTDARSSTRLERTPGGPAETLLSLQAVAGNRAVLSLMRPALPPGRPVVQRMSAINTFQKVIGEMVEVLGADSKLGRIMLPISKKNTLSGDDDAEQQIFFRTAWQGQPGDAVDDGDDRVMYENLVHNAPYRLGEALKQARMRSDVPAHLKMPVGAVQAGEEKLAAALQNALFFRAERQDSNAVANGRLDYDPEKHGSKGSASKMPGKKAEGVKARAAGYLFVTKERKEAADYVEKAQGGARELLVIVASQREADDLIFDVDSRGYKTRNPLTGIVDREMTAAALKNLATWVDAAPDPAVANSLLRSIMAW